MDSLHRKALSFPFGNTIAQPIYFLVTRFDSQNTRLVMAPTDGGITLNNEWLRHIGGKLSNIPHIQLTVEIWCVGTVIFIWDAAND